MPPAPGEPVVSGNDAAARADAPDPRALRPHYPCLEGLRTIGVMALFFQHTGFTLESCQAVGVVSEWFGKEFDGNTAAQFGIGGLVDFSHAART